MRDETSPMPYLRALSDSRQTSSSPSERLMQSYPALFPLFPWLASHSHRPIPPQPVRRRGKPLGSPALSAQTRTIAESIGLHVGLSAEPSGAHRWFLQSNIVVLGRFVQFIGAEDVPTMIGDDSDMIGKMMGCFGNEHQSLEESHGKKMPRRGHSCAAAMAAGAAGGGGCARAKCLASSGSPESTAQAQAPGCTQARS